MATSALADRLTDVRETVAAACAAVGRDPVDIRIIAVTKGHPAGVVLEALDADLYEIAENRVPEAIAKFAEIGPRLEDHRVRRHLVGHLQRNKAGKAAELFDWIQSIDSLRVAEAVDARLPEGRSAMQVLVEINAAGEEAKHGLAPEHVVEEALRIAELPGLRVRGLMAMALWTADEAPIRSAFRVARRAFDELVGHWTGPDAPDTLSMGMSNDYPLAIKEGATMVRLGTVLFGPRS
jgi:pyridoxal phosphate enzyme (YggS family)